MKLDSWSLLVPLAPVAALAAVPAVFGLRFQEAEAPPPAEGGLQRRGARTWVGGRDERPVVHRPFDRDAWRERLADPDLDAREAAFERIVERARRAGPARAFLDELAAGDDVELAWTARLARKRASQAGVRASLFADFDAMERHLDELSRRFAPGWNPRLDTLVIPFSSWTSPGVLRPGGVAGRSVEVRGGDGGWTVRVTEEGEEGTSTREYEGESLEEILEAHPELRDEIGMEASFVGPGMRLKVGTSSEALDIEGLLRAFAPTERGRLRIGLGAPVPMEVPTEKLGVRVRRRAEGPGLVILDAVPGTIAHRIGLAPGDVLLEVDGRPLVAEDDVSVAMAAWDRARELEVVWLDGGGGEAFGGLEALGGNGEGDLVGLDPFLRVGLFVAARQRRRGHRRGLPCEDLIRSFGSDCLSLRDKGVGGIGEGRLVGS